MFFDLAAACAASIRAMRNHFDPCRVVPERCLPADSLFPGHMPAHDALCGYPHKSSYLDWPVMWTGQVELRMGADLVVGLST